MRAITPKLSRTTFYQTLLGLLVAACGCLAAPIPGLAESAETPGSRDVKFEHISIEQGLSQVTVYCILQDERGFLWFGTQDGLNKYDGYNFSVYKPIPGRNSLAHNSVRAIYQDQQGALWIGTEGGGLDKFDRDTEQFIHYQHDPNDAHSLSNNFVQAIYQDQEGALWIGTLGGLNKLDPEQELFTRYQYDGRDRHSLSHDSVWAIYQDREGVLWVGTDHGLDKLDPDKEQFAHYRNDYNDPHSLSSNAVRVIYQDREGVLWVGTRGGLNRYEPKNDWFTRHRYDGYYRSGILFDYTVHSIFQDHEGVLWVGTASGLDSYDRKTRQTTHYENKLDAPDSLSNSYIRSIYQDREGILWIGTYLGGVNKLDRSIKRFTHYPAQSNNSDDLGSSVQAFYQDQNGVLWVGTGDGGLRRFNRDKRALSSYQYSTWDLNSLSDDSVRAIYRDREGVLWVGTRNGLDRFDDETRRFSHYHNSPSNEHSLSSNSVMAIYEDREGALWIGTYGGGINKFDRERELFTRYQHDDNDAHSLSNDYVNALFQDSEGALWIGTDNGLNRLDSQQEQFTRYHADPENPRSLSNNRITSIHQDQEGALWIGTLGGGLNKFNPQDETFSHYREKDGLPNDVIYGILEQQDAPGGSLLWLSTNKGLSRFDPRTETFRNYDASNGLQSNEFNAGAFYKSSSGEMFFGGINGFNAFYPGEVREDNPYVPPVVLTLLQQGGEDVGIAQAIESLEEITFKWPNDFFEFEFAALSYSQPQKNQYAYVLEGFDKDWTLAGTRRFGKYTNLPGGTYTLRIKGSNNDGVWNERGTAIEITIVPPFWETTWFIGALGLALVGSVLGGYRWRVNSIQARNRALESQVAERTREIEQRRQELEALYRADAELHRHLRLDQVLQALVDIAVDILQADKSSLMVWDEGQERLVVRVARGFAPSTLAQLSFTPGQGSVGLVAASGQAVIVENARADSRVALRRLITELEGICSFMQVPIKIDGAVFGVFSADYVQPRVFGDDEQRLFSALAQRAALAIDTAQLYEQTQELAVMEERGRLARDLHDAVTQTLFSASLIAEVLPETWESDPDEGRELLGEMRLLSRGALAEMRTLLLELRPAALIETALSDLLHQLAQAATGREGIPATVTTRGQCALPPDVHVALYRIAQEALNNVVKHAQAAQVTVDLNCSPPPPSPAGIPPQGGKEGGKVELRISDDGCGFDPGNVPPDRLGLGILRERAQAIGATLEIKSEPGQGTQIIVTWDERRQTNDG